MKTVSIATGLLSGTAAPSRLSLALPGASVVVNRRRDVSVPEEAARSASAPGTSNDTTASTWVGEVVGSRRAGSSAIFVTAENGGVYGKITYIERRTNKQRTFTVRGPSSTLKQPDTSSTAVDKCPAVQHVPALLQHCVAEPAGPWHPSGPSLPVGTLQGHTVLTVKFTPGGCGSLGPNIASGMCHRQQLTPS